MSTVSLISQCLFEGEDPPEELIAEAFRIYVRRILAETP